MKDNMNDTELRELIGTTPGEAEIAVRSHGLNPQTLHQDACVAMSAIRSDVVRIWHDGNRVVSAETQASIDSNFNF